MVEIKTGEETSIRTNITRALLMTVGVMVVVLIGSIPFFMGIGLGADLLFRFLSDGSSML